MMRVFSLDKQESADEDKKQNVQKQNYDFYEEKNKKEKEIRENQTKQMIAKVENILQPSTEENKSKQEVDKIEEIEDDLNSKDDISGMLNRRIRRN